MEFLPEITIELKHEGPDTTSSLYLIRLAKDCLKCIRD